MKAPDFLYHRAGSVAEAIGLLADYGGEGRILAGGQSLMPMLNMRLWRPAALIDINRIAGLDGIEADGTDIRIGALVRYATLERSRLIAERLPLIAKMVRFIGDRQVRNRGTVGGSLAQGDPTGEMPLACLTLGASVEVAGPAGTRAIPMEDFYAGSYAATLGFDELATGIVFPRQPNRSAFREVCRRHNDFALLSVAAIGDRDSDGCWTGVRIGLGGVHETPVLADDAMDRLEGSRLEDADIEEAARAALTAIDPPSDIRGSAEYRAHLVPHYVARTLRDLCASA